MKSINLFIDTNIFLSFYHFSSDNIEELNKLLKSIELEKVKLWIPQQVIHEHRRNRDSKLADAVKQIKDCRFSYNFPVFINEHQDYKDFRKKVAELEKIYSNIFNSVMKDIENEKLNSDKLIKDLFNIGTIIDEDIKIIKQANRRYKIGNPPGKGGSLGDAINWLSLLESIPKKQNLYFISDDKDYCSDVNKDKFNSFLLKEWNEINGGDLIFYKRLSSFFKDILPEIKFAADIEINIAIERLERSGSFSSTHKAIEKLSGYKKFTKEQVGRIINVPYDNQQVGWIINDDDVNRFYRNLITTHKKHIDKEIIDYFDEQLDELPED